MSKIRNFLSKNAKCPKCQYSFLLKFFGPSMGYGVVGSKWECPVCGKTLEFDLLSKVIYWLIFLFASNLVIVGLKRIVDANFFSVVGAILITFFLVEVISRFFVKIRIRKSKD